MPADVAEVVGAGTTQEQRFRIVIFLNVYFVKSSITIISYPKGNRAHKIIMINQFNISEGVNFFPTPYNFICAGIVYVFYEMR